MEESAGMACRGSPPLQPQIHTSEEDAGMDSRRLHPQIHASEEEGAGATRRRTSPAAPLPNDDDMLREILLRLPPQPSSLPRAAAVCSLWRGLVADPRFLRHFYAHHRKPPLLGVFSRRIDGPGVAFSPILGHPDRVPPKRFNLGRCSSARHGYDLLDCRHGLVLLVNRRRTEVVVCDPVTGQRRRVAIPPEHKTHFINGAVLCAATDQGHVHGSCHSTPFKVVFMSQYMTCDQPLARVYSSETGVWGDRILTEPPCEISRKPAVLVGNRLYWLSMGNAILEFDMGEQSLTMTRGPPVTDDILFPNCQIIQAEDGAVGYAILSYPRIEMWRKNINGHGVAMWVPWKTIELHKILRLPSPPHEGMDVRLLGYDDDDVVFLCHAVSVYMVQLKSMQSKKLDKIFSTGNHFFPFKSFFTPGAAIAGGFNGAEMLHIG